MKPLFLRGIVIGGLLGVACTQAWAADKPARLRLCHESQNSYPWTLRGRPGLNVLLLQAAGQKLGVQIEFFPVPWKRCLAEMQDGVYDGAFAASFKPERMEMGVYPMAGDKPDESLVLMFDSYSLYRRKDGGAQWDGTTIRTAGNVGAPAGYSIVDALKKMNLRVDVGAKTADAQMKKLLVHRLEGVALQTLEGDFTLRANPEYARLVEKVEPPLVNNPIF